MTLVPLDCAETASPSFTSPNCLPTRSLKQMIRASLITATLLSTSIAPAQAASDISSQEFYQGTGTACLAGGAIVGVAALVAGPAVIAAAAGGAALPAGLTTGASAMLGCGASATAALAYYGSKWTYKSFNGGSDYPLLYPMREDLAEGATAAK